MDKALAKTVEQPLRILITGAAGGIGTVLVNALRDRYTLRGLDIRPMDHVEDAIIGNLNDFDTVLAASQGMDAVIHLGGLITESTWQAIHTNNILGTYNVFEAARQSGVRRIVFASRAGVLSSYPKDVQRTVDLPPRPVDYYSVSKLFGEQLGHMYSSRHGMEFVAIRIGLFQQTQPEARHPHQISHADTVQVFERALIHPGVSHEIVFGVSDSTWQLYDIDHGREAIAYHPQDKSIIEPQE